MTRAFILEQLKQAGVDEKECASVYTTLRGFLKIQINENGIETGKSVKVVRKNKDFLMQLRNSASLPNTIKRYNFPGNVWQKIILAVFEILHSNRRYERYKTDPRAVRRNLVSRIRPTFKPIDSLEICFTSDEPGSKTIIILGKFFIDETCLIDRNIPANSIVQRLSLQKAKEVLRQLRFYDDSIQKLSYADPCYQQTVFDVTTDEHFRLAIQNMLDTRNQKDIVFVVRSKTGRY